MTANSAGQPLRQALWPLGLLYGAVAALRNWTFDAGLRRVHRLPVPVVSVGNLTVGGTGKTPTVAWLCALARAQGRRPGVLARGYGRAPGAALNDEGAMLQRRLPWLLQQQEPDRVAAGRRLVAAGADFVVLDDGFQHRRLHRDLDVVCLDAALPFGNGLCLPAGDLREFRSGLRRAGLVLLTRAGGLDGDALAARVVRVRQLAGRSDLPVYACEHGPGDVVVEPRGEVLPVAALRGRRVWLLSGIARPESFRATVAALGAEVVGEHRHRDHHRFTPAEVAAAATAARAADALLLTTEKDAARLAGVDVERHVLRIELRFVGAPPTTAELRL
ncbi:MAG: tetraacyldisaccharide 4'-kinase [Planctomycetes bacterium]|nr:tetraacyldisaccharide 4'-kinase [Planctomycetota bacterium]